MTDQTIWGGMPREADIRFSNAGKPWATFTIANSARYKDDQGQWQSKDEAYIDVVLWGDEAEIVGTFPKGTQLAVQGRFVTRKFEQDGKQRSVLQFKASKVAQVVKADRNNQGQSSRPAVSQPAEPWGQPAQAGGGDVWGAPGAEYPAADSLPF